MKNQNKFLNFLDNIEGYFAMYAIAVMGVVLLLQVFARYLFGSPLTWSEELARYIFIWICFIGAGYGVKHHLHIEMSSLFNLLPKKGQIALQVVLNLFAIAMFAYIMPGAIEYTTQQAVIDSPIVPIPMSLVVISIPIGCALIIFRLIVDTINVIRTGELKQAEGGDVV